MFGKLLAVLLVFGWVGLSAFDLLEDLRLPSGDSAYTHGGKSHSPHWSRHPSLANNIVESAVTAHGAHSPLLRLNDIEPVIRLLWSSSRVLALHKLHRVFLI
ncbi:MAG: hypothetical protein FJ143_06120 [Deltaproteobacteria bacterium]|nr:hypothetical protein [Deltaproteobacteria bacterium]